MSTLTERKCALCGERGDIRKHHHKGGPDYVTCGDVMCELAPGPGIMLDAWNMLADVADRCAELEEQDGMCEMWEGKFDKAVARLAELENHVKRLQSLLMAAVSQACEDSNGKLWHTFMSAWESAFEYLEDRGLMTGNEADGFELVVDVWDELDNTESLI